MYFFLTSCEWNIEKEMNCVPWENFPLFFTKNGEIKGWSLKSAVLVKMYCMVSGEESMSKTQNSYLQTKWNWICQEKHNNRLNAMSMKSLRSVCSETRGSRIKNEWVLSKYGLNTKLTIRKIYWDCLIVYRKWIRIELQTRYLKED